LKSSVQEARPNHRERILVLSLVVVRRCCGIMKRVYFIGIALIVVVGLAAWSSSALIPINNGKLLAQLPADQGRYRSLVDLATQPN